MGSIGGAPGVGVVSTLASQAFIVSISSIAVTPVTITWSTGGALPTGTTYGDLVVTQINSSVSGHLARRHSDRQFEYCPFTGASLKDQ
jgi:hypothetical protein